MNKCLVFDDQQKQAEFPNGHFVIVGIYIFKDIRTYSI